MNRTAAVAALIWIVVRALKSDTRVPINIPSRWRPVVAIALGQVAAGVDAVAAGRPWLDAAADGLIAAGLAVAAHELGVEVIRGGRDVPVGPLAR